MTQAEEQWSTGYLNYANWMRTNYERAQNTAKNQTETDEVSKISSEGDNVDQCVNMEPTEALDEQSRSDIWNNASN